MQWSMRPLLWLRQAFDYFEKNKDKIPESVCKLSEQMKWKPFSMQLLRCFVCVWLTFAWNQEQPPKMTAADWRKVLDEEQSSKESQNGVCWFWICESTSKRWGDVYRIWHFNEISGRSTLSANYLEVWIALGLPSAAEERYMEDGEEELLDLEGEEEEMHEPALSLTVVETEQVFDSKVEIEGTKAATWTAGVQVRVFQNLCFAFV